MSTPSGRIYSLFELKATLTCSKKTYFRDFTDASRLKKRGESPTNFVKRLALSAV